MFQKAVKRNAKLRLSIQGPSGSGKTYTSLAIATSLNAGKVAVVDTEHGSASKYADLFDFDVMELKAPYHPDNYANAIAEAAKAGYGVIILDSLTHAWKGEGGILELVTEIAKRKYGGNTYAAWNDATPIQKRLVESIVGSSIHVIATMRSKMEYVQEKDERGKSVIRKVGMAPEQREDIPYEFDVVLDMNTDNEAVVSKTRCSELTGKLIAKPGKQVADVLSKWLIGDGSEQRQPQPPVIAPTLPVPQAEKKEEKQTTPHPAAKVAIKDGSLKTLHGVGTKVYGDGWEAKRHELVASITEGRTNSSSELHEDEAQKLIAGISQKLQKQAA
jgi:nucleoside-triphosphatase THEP1